MNTFIDFLEKLLIQLICFLDAFEKNDEKLIHSFSLEGIKVETDTGFKSVSHIHMTKKFVLYKILLENGLVTDYAMNTLCAAGTGAFLSSQAKRLGIKVEDMGKIALLSKSERNICKRFVCWRFYTNERRN